MAETKKFLDFTGLQKYDELLKKKVADDIKVVQDDLNTRKVKDIANSDTITWSKAENGTYTGSVKGVVLDNADYSAVKNNATQSAAAWTKFLEGITNLYPDNVTPALKDLATKTETSDALASAKSYADGLVKDAEGNVKFDAVGSAAQALNDAKSYADGLVKNYDAKGAAAQALVDAKAYADGLNTAMSSRVDVLEAIDHTAYKAADEAILASAKSYANSLASNYDAVGSAATAEQNAKAYADGLAKNYDAAGSAESAKNAAISAANTYTDGKIAEVNETISGINASIAGGVHFRGVVDPLPVSPFTGYTNGDIVIVGNKEYILNKPTEGDGEWVELGDTTAESQRITNLEGHVNTLRGDENTTGSVNNAIKVAKSYADGKIDDLVGASGQVGKNTAAIAKLNGGEDEVGSVNNAIKVAKAYADGKKKEATDYTDSEITKLQSSTGQVGINKAAIATLNGNASTEGSVEYKIAQAVSNIEASIETISETDIAGLFK